MSLINLFEKFFKRDLLDIQKFSFIRLRVAFVKPRRKIKVQSLRTVSGTRKNASEILHVICRKTGFFLEFADRAVTRILVDFELSCGSFYKYLLKRCTELPYDIDIQIFVERYDRGSSVMTYNLTLAHPAVLELDVHDFRRKNSPREKALLPYDFFGRVIRAYLARGKYQMRKGFFLLFCS
jgi:hypothetical protein